MHQIIPIIPRTPFTSVATAMELPLARNVNVAGAVSGVLVVKVHSSPTNSTTWTVHAQNAAVSAEDPGINFVDTSGDVVTKNISGTTQNLFHASFSAPIGEQVNVFLSAPAAAATITISVDLVIRDA
jgi:hypothetical protein